MSQKAKIKYEEVKEYISSFDIELLTKEYENMKQLLELRCNCGNIFNTTLDAFKFKNKRTCNFCSIERVRDANRLSYKEVQDYIQSKGCKLLSKIYSNNAEKLIIQCSCGNVFNKSLNKFKDGQDKCSECSNRRSWDYLSIRKYIEKSGCKLLSSTYKNRKQKLVLQCPCENTFITDFHSFLYQNKHHCDECGISIRAEKNRKGIDHLKEIVKETSNSTLVSEGYTNYHEKLIFQCACENLFFTSFTSFIHGKKMCDLCSPNSKMEYNVELFLIENKINYIAQYSFEDLRGISNGKLRFDFAIFDAQNTLLFLLELDGEQHFKPNEFMGGEEKYLVRVTHDELKNNYCEKNKIPLERIKYDEISEIENVLANLFSKYDNPVPSL